MRAWKVVFVGIAITGGGYLLYQLVMVLLFASMFMRASEKSPQEIEAERHAELAVKFEHDGKVDEAVAEWRLAHADGLYPMTTRRIAELLEGAGRYEDALVEIDREGPAVSWGEYCDLRMGCLEAWKGPDAAVAWLTELDAQHLERPFLQEELGEFHFYGGRPAAALAPLDESVRRALVGQPFVFDEHDELVANGGPLPKEWDDLPDLWSALEILGRAHEQLGDDENAWKQATRAVSFHRWMNRMKGYHGAHWQEAGSFDGRLVRARVLLRRGALDDAATELDFADEVVSNYPPHQEELAAARAELARRLSAK